MAHATDEQVRQWQEQGWVLLPGLVPADEIDAALDDLWEIYPRPEEFHAGAGGERTQAFLAGTDERRLIRREVPDGEGPAFRSRQFLGRRLFPFGLSGRLDRLTVHPNLVDFVERALDDIDIRLYQMGLWAKYTGLADYAQPFHQDQNHSVVPPRMDPGWWHLEGFLYLSDVEDDLAPTHLVPRHHDRGEIGFVARTPQDEPDWYEREISVAGPRGSYFAYRPDVWHRGVDLVRPGGARFVYGLSFKLANQDWIQYESVQSRANTAQFKDFAAACTPRQLALFGVPLPGDPFWNEAMLAAMADRYPDLDLTPWQEAQR